MGRSSGQICSKRNEGANARHARVCVLGGGKCRTQRGMFGRHLKDKHPDQVFGDFKLPDGSAITAINWRHRDQGKQELVAAGNPKPTLLQIREHLTTVVDNGPAVDYKKKFKREKKLRERQNAAWGSMVTALLEANLCAIGCGKPLARCPKCADTRTKDLASAVWDAGAKFSYDPALGQEKL